MLLITHDIDLALNVADRIAVFYAGTTVEICPASDFRGDGSALRHPYSRAFIDVYKRQRTYSVRIWDT